MKMVTFEIDNDTDSCITVWPDKFFLVGQTDGTKCVLCAVGDADSYWPLREGMVEAKKKLEDGYGGELVEFEFSPQVNPKNQTI